MKLKEKASQLRKDLKEKYNLTRTDVSITSQHGLYDDKILVKLKTILALQNYNLIEQESYKYKNVDYDSVTMETLLGGNTFVFINFQYDLLDEYSVKYQAIAEELFQKAIVDRMMPVKILENTIAYYWIANGTMQICYDNRLREIRNVQDLAKKLAMIEIFNKI